MSKTPTPPGAAESAQSHTSAYVDAIESGVARILLQTEDDEWRGYSLPAHLLPKEVREGSWLKLTFDLIPPPAGSLTPHKPSGGAPDGGGTIYL